MKKAVLAISLLTSFASVANAQNLSEGKISEIRVQYNRILVSQQGFSNPLGCSKTDYLMLPQSDNIHHKNMYATLLAARSSGQAVRIKSGECGSGGYSVISEVWLYQ